MFYGRLTMGKSAREMNNFCTSRQRKMIWNERIEYGMKKIDFGIKKGLWDKIVFSKALKITETVTKSRRREPDFAKAGGQK